MTTYLCEFVTIETPTDFADEQRDPETGALTGYTARPTAFVQMPPDTRARMVTELQRLLDAGEGECSCDFVNLVDEASGQMCSEWVGWLLHEDDEHPVRSGVEWHTAVLVDNGEVCAVVCEDDSPATLYENAREYRDRPSV